MLKRSNISNLLTSNVPDYNSSDDYVRQVNTRDRRFERVLKTRDTWTICVSTNSRTAFTDPRPCMAETLLFISHPVTLKTGFPIVVNISTRASEIFLIERSMFLFSLCTIFKCVRVRQVRMRSCLMRMRRVLISRACAWCLQALSLLVMKCYKFFTLYCCLRLS